MKTNFSHNMSKYSIALVNCKTLDLTKMCLNLLKIHLDTNELVKNRVDV